jgi:hypothetical protein
MRIYVNDGYDCRIGRRPTLFAREGVKGIEHETITRKGALISISMLMCERGLTR